MASTDYLFNELTPFPNTAGGSVGATASKAKGVLLTNTNLTNGLTAGLITYRASGGTGETRVVVGAGKTQIFPIRVWGVSFESGLTGGFIS